jgi:NADPH:quinone reductase-like Zn-dependent oxidoreductase
MPWRHIRIVRFGGPETLERAEEATVPEPDPNEVRIRVLAAGTWRAFYAALGYYELGRVGSTVADLSGHVDQPRPVEGLSSSR